MYVHVPQAGNDVGAPAVHHPRAGGRRGGRRADVFDAVADEEDRLVRLDAGGADEGDVRDQRPLHRWRGGAQRHRGQSQREPTESDHRRDGSTRRAESGARRAALPSARRIQWSGVLPTPRSAETPRRAPRATAAELFAVLALGLLALAASLFSLRATDLFWHLASGRFMVEQLALPRHDPFRFGIGGGLAWVDHEWLFQLLVYAVERLGGLDALVALRAALVLTLAGVLYIAIRRTGSGRAVAVALATTALLARGRGSCCDRSSSPSSRWRPSSRCCGASRPRLATAARCSG